MIPAALAVGESLGSSGADVLVAIVTGYEVLGHITGAVHLRERGWDQGIHVVVAAAMAAGKLLGLTPRTAGSRGFTGNHPQHHDPSDESR